MNHNDHNDPFWSIMIIQMHQGFYDSLQEGRAITFFCPEKERFFALKTGVDVEMTMS